MSGVRVYDAIGSRRGLIIATALIGFVAVAGAWAVWSAVQHVRSFNSLLETASLREGLIASNDINRLAQIVTEAEIEGEMTPELAKRFSFAADVLYVRSEQFTREVERLGDFRPAPAARQSMQDIVEFSDAQIAAGFPDVDQLGKQFFELADAARRHIVIYMDEIAHLQHQAKRSQNLTLQRLTLFLALMLGTQAIIAMATMLLLRREVVARQERAKAERKADYLAYNDQLTRLPNRSHFYEQLEQVLAKAQPTSMIFMDLDDFKGINDTHGHTGGDAVLCAVADRLRHALRDLGGLPVRLAGDEFAAILPTEDGSVLLGLCNKLLDMLSQPVAFEGNAISVRVSIGVAKAGTLFEADNPNVEALVSAADFALYEAKSAGRNTYRFYDQVLARRHSDQRSLLDAIPAALENNEFFAAYQPKVLLENKFIYGFEALIRWQRNGRTIQPENFLPMAEESRLIIDMDLWMLDEATRQIALWNARYGTAYSVSVNLSVLHLDSRAIIDSVARVLTKNKLPAELLTLEITETVLIRDWGKVQNLLAELKMLGVKISLDDFGTGYSSLGYLRRIAADELKIDRSFVTDLENTEETRLILDAVVDIANSLRMKIVAEGIETDAQSRLLHAFGCHLGQGFLFGRPMKASDIEELLAQPPRAAPDAMRQRA